MLVEKLRTISKDNGIKFNYGADFWQNLQDLPDDTDKDFEERQKYLLLLWKDRGCELGQFSEMNGYSFEGEMVLCVRSKISDPDYNFKYENRIKHLESESLKLLNGFSLCDNWRVVRWRETEVSNQYDTNVDGLKITFKILVDAD